MTAAIDWQNRICTTAERVSDLRGSSHVQIARDLRKALEAEGVTIVVSDGDAWAYNEDTGAYDRLEQETLASAVQRLAGAHYVAKVDEDGNEKKKSLGLSDGSVRGVLGCLMRHHQVLRTGFFDMATPGIAFEDCFVSVNSSGKVQKHPHSPEHRCRASLPFRYGDTEHIDTWLNFLRKLWQDESQETTEDLMAVLQEFLGACLLGIAPQYDKCLLLSGEKGSNGKSSLLFALDAVFPKRLQASAEPSLWKDGATLSSLKGALINKVSEISPEELLDNSATFKKMISGDTVTSRSLYREPVTWRPQAGHVFSLNKNLKTRDHSGGFWRRFLVLPFEHNFANDPDKRTRGEIEDELAKAGAAIATWAIWGAARLAQVGDYTTCSRVVEMIDNWRAEADSVLSWVRQCCGPVLCSVAQMLNGTPRPSWVRDNWMAASTAYDKYAGFCGVNNFRPVSGTEFGS